MSGSVLRDACSKGDLWNIERILGGAQDFSLMRSPIYTGVQSEGWVRRKAVYDIINSRDNLGQAALHICIKHGQSVALQKILAVEGVDINLPGMGDYSPAILAATKNEHICLQHLIDAGIDVNQCDDTDWSLVHHTTALDAADALQVLLRTRGLLVDRLNSEGHTPLMMACIKNSVSMVEALVGAGADPQRKHRRTSQSCWDMCATVQARRAIDAGAVLNVKRMEMVEREKEEKRMLARAKAAAAVAATAAAAPAVVVPASPKAESEETEGPSADADVDAKAKVDAKADAKAEAEAESKADVGAAAEADAKKLDVEAEEKAGANAEDKEGTS